MLNVLRVKNKAIKTAHSDDNGIVLVFIEHVNLILFPFLLFFFVYNEQELLCLVTIIRIFVTHAIDVILLIIITLTALLTRQVGRVLSNSEGKF